MKVKEMVKKLDMEALTDAGMENEVTGVYACDLLSRVMSGCQEGDAWITVQTHLNVIAVAELDDAACIIVPEGIAAPADTLEKAEETGIAVVSSQLGTYELCWRLHELLS